MLAERTLRLNPINLEELRFHTNGNENCVSLHLLDQLQQPLAAIYEDVLWLSDELLRFYAFGLDHALNPFIQNIHQRGKANFPMKQMSCESDRCRQ